MPSKATFSIPPIAQLLDDEVLDASRWLDPFAGMCSIVPWKNRNDLNPAIEAKEHLDALAFLERQSSGSMQGVLFDPPYSITQAKQMYDAYGVDKLTTHVSNMRYWKLCKDNMARIIKPGGKAICFGWSSMGLGKARGFRMSRILMVPHGGSKNDTLCTVEIKVEV